MNKWDELRKLLKEQAVISVGLSYILYPLIDQLEAEGDKLQRTIATGYCGECDIHKEKLEEIREFLRNASVASEFVPDIIMEMLDSE